MSVNSLAFPFHLFCIPYNANASSSQTAPPPHHTPSLTPSPPDSHQETPLSFLKETTSLLPLVAPFPSALAVSRDKSPFFSAFFLRFATARPARKLPFPPSEKPVRRFLTLFVTAEGQASSLISPFWQNFLFFLAPFASSRVFRFFSPCKAPRFSLPFLFRLRALIVVFLKETCVVPQLSRLFLFSPQWDSLVHVLIPGSRLGRENLFACYAWIRLFFSSVFFFECRPQIKLPFAPSPTCLSFIWSLFATSGFSLTFTHQSTPPPPQPD